jgi:NHL repeat
MALTSRLRVGRWPLLLGLTLFVLFACNTAMADVPEKLWTAGGNGCENNLVLERDECGGAASETISPRGTGASQGVPGHIYVSEQLGNRISEFTAWGGIVRVWGWGVVKSGPGNDPQNEIQEVIVSGASEGHFSLSFSRRKVGFPKSAPIEFDASAAEVQAAIEADSGNYFDPGDVVVSGSDGGPWTIEFTGRLADQYVGAPAPVDSTLDGVVTSKVLTVGASYEICVPADGDECRSGQGRGEPLAGALPGMVPWPQGLAVDSTGNIYVVDVLNHRVQKFSPEGEFLLMFGGEVNKTSGADVCTKVDLDDGDECGAGTTGAASGEFSANWPFSSYIAIGPDDTVYVGDEDRIQEFDAAGNHQGEIKLEAGVVGALAADPSSNDLYFAYAGKSNVQRLSFDEGEGKWKVSDTIAAAQPTALAVDVDGVLYVVESAVFMQHKIRILRFDADGEALGAFAEDEFDLSIGIATGAGCLGEGADLYLANASQLDSFIAAYGPPPDDPGCPPPPAAPEILSQHAVAVDSHEATVRAQINPHFWSGSQGDTAYYVQYATIACIEEPAGWEGACVREEPSPPGFVLAGGVIDGPLNTAAIALTGLEPATAYRYRFVATNDSPPPGGTSVIGAGGTPGKVGKDGGFRTFPVAGGVEPCANDALRIGTSARLPDCRAYELVSPVEKHGTDAEVFNNVNTVNQSAPDGEAFTYSVVGTPFGEPESAPLTSQYMAERDTSSGWGTRSISPPRSSRFLTDLPVYLPIQIFTPDLCQGWVFQDTDLTLTLEAPQEVVNLYRQRGLRASCGEEAGYELLTPEAPPNIYAPPESVLFFRPIPEGFSADGSVSLFRANGTLTEDAADTNVQQLYAERAAEAPRLASVFPDGVAHADAEAGLGDGGNLSFVEGSNLEGAVSVDGARAFWSARASGSTAPKLGLYLRTNPTEPESPREHGAARGKGDVIGPAEGKGNIKPESNAESIAISHVEVINGGFAVGQTITDPAETKGGLKGGVGGIKAGTKIVAIELEEEKEGKKFYKLTLNQKTTKFKTADPLEGLPSNTVLNASAESSAFQAGQEITGDGVPAETTIEAVEEGGAKLVLSKTPTQTVAAGAALSNGSVGKSATLSATSDCTEPETLACTIEIASGIAEFVTADPTGSLAYYTSGGKLYELDVDKAIAYEPGAASEVAGGLPGDSAILGAAKDGSRIYFASTLDLGAGANPMEEEAVPGQPNLYLYERGSGFAFIGTVLGGSEDDRPSALGLSSLRRAARVSPDGLHAVFPTRAALTDYDNTDQASGQPDSELFLYDAAVGGEEAALRCVSCNPTGQRPRGRRTVTLDAGQELYAAATIPGWQAKNQPTRALSDDGRRLFFESYDGLLPGDTNGAADVYQWEAAGKGTCKTSSPEYFADNGGCIALISSGRSPEDSTFIDASADGRDVFFNTGASLVGQDPGLLDVYDARIGGGFPPPLPPTIECEGQACQSPAPAPPPPSLSSSVPRRPDNVSESSKRPRPCPKGKRKVRRGGKTRCVPRRRANRSRRAGR